MKPIHTIIIGMAAIFATSTVVAQDNLNVEIRSGISFPTQEFGNSDLSTGFGFEGALGYRFMPHLSAYAGWGWNQFSSENSFAGPDVDVEETGYTFGFKFAHPFRSSSLRYFIMAGGLYNHIEIENREGVITADSGHGLGWQIGTGVEIPLGERWNLVPDVRYRSLSQDIETNTTTAVDLNSISLGIAISRSF